MAKSQLLQRYMSSAFGPPDVSTLQNLLLPEDGYADEMSYGCMLKACSSSAAAEKAVTKLASVWHHVSVFNVFRDWVSPRQSFLRIQGRVVPENVVAGTSPKYSCDVQFPSCEYCIGWLFSRLPNALRV